MAGSLMINNQEISVVGNQLNIRYLEHDRNPEPA